MLSSGAVYLWEESNNKKKKCGKNTDGGGCCSNFCPQFTKYTISFLLETNFLILLFPNLGRGSFSRLPNLGPYLMANVMLAIFYFSN